MGPLSKEQRSTTQVKIKGNILPNFSDIRYIPGWLFKKNYPPFELTNIPHLFSESFSQAFGPGGLGICGVRQVPGLEEVRKKLLPLAHRLATLYLGGMRLKFPVFFGGGTLPIPPTNSWLEVLQWGRNLQKKWSFPFIWGSFPLNHDYGRKSSLLWLIVEMNVVYELLNVLQLPKTNSQRPLKMDGWKTILSFREGLFSRAMFV